MGKNIIIGVLGVAVAVLAAVVAMQNTNTTGVVKPTGEDASVATAPSPSPEGKGGAASAAQNPSAAKAAPPLGEDASRSDKGADATHEPAAEVEAPAAVPDPVAVERDIGKVKPGAMERIPDEGDGEQHFTSIFEVNGRGVYAKWGGAVQADFYYLVKVVASSKVESKEEMSPGRIRVTEIREFKEAQELLKPINIDAHVDLETLPIQQIAATGYMLGATVSLFAPAAGAGIAKQVTEFKLAAEALDGRSARPAIDTLKRFGIDVDRIIQEPVEEYLQGLLAEVHTHVNAVQGKKYRFKYWTDKYENPIRVKYENVDGSPLSEEERNVLNYVNLFLDCQVLPDRNERPGAEWKIEASSIAGMFGAVACEGRAQGDVTVTRGNDLPDGNWDLTIQPSTVSYYLPDGRPAGNVKIMGGKAVGDASKAVLRELDISGIGKLRKRESTTRLWFYEFVTKVDGDCDFRTILLPRSED